MDISLDGVDRLAALEKLVDIGRGSATTQSFREILSPGLSGVLPCLLLSTIDFHGKTPEMHALIGLLRSRSEVGGRLEKVRVSFRFVTLLADISRGVMNVGSLDPPSGAIRTCAMELPEFCFVEEGHEWWKNRVFRSI